MNEKSENLQKSQFLTSIVFHNIPQVFMWFRGKKLQNYMM
jgi:hypothetical protein